MPLPQDSISMALFCDFENVALGVRDANYDKFDIKRVLERLLLKGSIVVKKSYCDWERYKGFKAAMHEANFELIEIPHVRQSGKNSADIRLVVDALDLCYTKSHVNTFVIISGDSDFSPLVSKLRENAKHVIGVGVKQSTSDLLIANCDEFIFYDDLVRESQRQAARRSGGSGRDAAPAQRRTPEEDRRRREEMDTRRGKAVEMAAETYEALVTDRDDGGRIWASVLKEAIKRRNPGFSESYYGFRTFGNLLEEAQGRGLLDFGRDEKSGTWVARGTGVPSAGVLVRSESAALLADATPYLGHHPAHKGGELDSDVVQALRDEPADAADVSGAVFTSVTVMPAPGALHADADALQAEHAPDEGGARRRSRGGRGRSKSAREGGRDAGREGAREGSAGRRHGETTSGTSSEPVAAPSAPSAQQVSAPVPAAAPTAAATPPAADSPARKRAPRKTTASKTATSAASAPSGRAQSAAPREAAGEASPAAAKKAPARSSRAKPKAAAKNAD